MSKVNSICIREIGEGATEEGIRSVIASWVPMLHFHQLVLTSDGWIVAVVRDGIDDEGHPSEEPEIFVMPRASFAASDGDN